MVVDIFEKITSSIKMLFPSPKKLDNGLRLRFARPYSITSLTIYSNATTAQAKEKQSEILRQGMSPGILRE